MKILKRKKNKIYVNILLIYMLIIYIILIINFSKFFKKLIDYFKL